MKISIIIPVLNEEKGIHNILTAVNELKGDKEIIIADGGSTDGTLKLIPPDFLVVKSARGRAIQMNTGAKLASGEVLLFLHCDCKLEAGALESIADAVKHGYKWGCFTMKFDKKGFVLSLISLLSNLRAGLLKIAFGDQGIFIEKGIFDELGGFPEIPIMEDLEFSIRIRKKYRPKQLKENIITSARRFEIRGPIRTIMFMHKMKLLYFLGVEPKILSRMYKDVR